MLGWNEQKPNLFFAVFSGLVVFLCFALDFFFDTELLYEVFVPVSDGDFGYADDVCDVALGSLFAFKNCRDV